MLQSGLFTGLVIPLWSSFYPHFYCLERRVLEHPDPGTFRWLSVTFRCRISIVWN